MIQTHLITVSLQRGHPAPHLHYPSSLPGLCAVVPSIQDPRGHDNTQMVFQPYEADHATGWTV